MQRYLPYAVHVAKKAMRPRRDAASLRVKLFLLECHSVSRISKISSLFSSVIATVSFLVLIR